MGLALAFVRMISLYSQLTQRVHRLSCFSFTLLFFVLLLCKATCEASLTPSWVWSICHGDRARSHWRHAVELSLQNIIGKSKYTNMKQINSNYLSCFRRGVVQESALDKTTRLWLWLKIQDWHFPLGYKFNSG